MAEANKHYKDLEPSYLFANIDKKVAEYMEKNPDADIIKLGIGDVTLPLPKACTDAMHEAVEEMAHIESFRGYPPYYGYDFLREAILKNDYLERGIELKKDEIFVSDGAKSDCGNILDIFDESNSVAVCDPVYPVYVDTNIMAGRKDNILLMECTEENGFFPQIPDRHIDIIYLCFPNNPTGEAASFEQLKKWVDYANRENSVILFDSAYEHFMREDKPRSIYEVEGAKTCAIEMRSFSKTAGFTGTRCGYTVVPEALTIGGTALNPMWARRQSTKFNGVSYITQRGAAAIYTPEGKKQVDEHINYYHENAEMIYNGLKSAGFKVFGAVNSPYVWLRVPEGYTSWEFFDVLLNKCRIVSTPGSGFGKAGEGFLRLTAFNTHEKTAQAIERIKKLF